MEKDILQFLRKEVRQQLNEVKESIAKLNENEELGMSAEQSLRSSLDEFLRGGPDDEKILEVLRALEVIKDSDG